MRILRSSVCEGPAATATPQNLNDVAFAARPKKALCHEDRMSYIRKGHFEMLLLRNLKLLKRQRDVLPSLSHGLLLCTLTVIMKKICIIITIIQPALQQEHAGCRPSSRPKEIV